MSTFIKGALVVLALFALLWFLQSRVGPQQSAHVEMEVNADALR